MKIDMNPEAVTARLRTVEQLRRLCLALQFDRQPPTRPFTESEPPGATAESGLRLNNRPDSERLAPDSKKD
jgi:hypothetical protein